MKTLYLDLFSGISGDMFIGALLDLGVDLRQLEAGLQKLQLQGYHLHARPGQKSGITGVKFDVHLEDDHDHEGDDGHDHDHQPDHGHGHLHDHGVGHHHGEHHEHEHSHEHAHGHGHEHEHAHEHVHSHDVHHHPHVHGRSFAEIERLILSSSLSPWVKEKSLAIFRRIAVAEGKIHGVPPAQVTFHEVGAVDSIVDIVGACVGLELLGAPRVLASPVTEGTGTVMCAHGQFPIPAPATLAILGERGIPLSQCGEPHELVTPTGAALIAEFVETFGPMRNLAAQKIGYGLGTRDNATRPNVLRAILGEATPEQEAHDWVKDTVSVLETNLDDNNSELLGYVMEKAFALGALDVFHTGIQMKKNRPGVMLTILCAETDADKLTELVLTQTTAFGVRRYTTERRKLVREFLSVTTRFGDVPVKIGKLDGRTLQAAPEYEACKKIADAAKVPLKQVYDAALRALDSTSSA